MQVKTFYSAWGSPKKLDKQVNEFLKRTDIKVKEIQFATSFSVPFAMIIFEMIDWDKWN